MHPTNELRFVERLVAKHNPSDAAGRTSTPSTMKVLQQKWMQWHPEQRAFFGAAEWRDVPLVKEGT